MRGRQHARTRVIGTLVESSDPPRMSQRERRQSQHPRVESQTTPASPPCESDSSSRRRIRWSKGTPEQSRSKYQSSKEIPPVSSKEVILALYHCRVLSVGLALGISPEVHN